MARKRRNRRREYWVRWRVERKLFEIGVAVINMLAPPAPDMDFVEARKVFDAWKERNLNWEFTN